MTNSVQESLGLLVSEQEGDQQLLEYIDTFNETIELQDSGLEAVRIQRDVGGNVVLATTVKVPNLRFRLGDLLLEAGGTGAAIAGLLDHPLRLVLAGIRFLRAVRQLATLEIRDKDAELLIAIFQLAQEEAGVQVGDLPMMLSASWDERQVARSLERLETLGCIELGMEGIIMNETILVQQVD